MNQYGYAYQKFWQALDNLATGTGSIQQRLLDAYIGALYTLWTPDIDLPRPLQTAFHQMIDWWMTSQQAVADEGSAAASIERLSDRQAAYCAGVIRDMALVLHHYDVEANKDEPATSELEVRFEMPPP